MSNREDQWRGKRKEKRNRIGQTKSSATHVLDNECLLSVFCTLDICSLILMASGDSSTGSMGVVLSQLITVKIRNLVRSRLSGIC